MKFHLTTILMLALTACGTDAAPETLPAASISIETAEVVALSRAAVDEADTESASEASFDASGDIVLAPSLMGDAVPLAGSELSPEAVAPVEALPTATFTLRRGETLSHFARWSELPVELIAETSGLDLDGHYPVGTEVVVAIAGEALSALEVRRTEHHRLRVDGYLASRGGEVATDFYKVRTGDTAWSVAKDQYSLPVWVLEAYNPAVDLDTLRPGQELMIPVVADTVVDAE